jgi:hypothetical protein
LFACQSALSFSGSENTLIKTAENMILVGSLLLCKTNLMFRALPNNREASAPLAAWLPFGHRQPFSDKIKISQCKLAYVLSRKFHKTIVGWYVERSEFCINYMYVHVII